MGVGLLQTELFAHTPKTDCCRGLRYEKTALKSIVYRSISAGSVMMGNAPRDLLRGKLLFETGCAGCSLTTEARKITGAGGAQLPLKLQPLLLLSCFFLGFFLRCHNYLLTSYLIGLHVQTAFVSALPMHRSRCDMCIPFCFPKQDCDAWCANSNLRSKKNATSL